MFIININIFLYNNLSLTVMVKKITQSLSFRLFILLTALMIVGFSFNSFYLISVHSSQLMDEVFISAERVSDIIKRSTRYGMLVNRKDDVHQIINTVGNEPGVDAIRIYNKKGDIIFSTNHSEVNMRVDLDAEACNICHNTKEPLTSLAISERHRVYRDLKGHRILGVINPIENEEECYNAACHAHSAEQTVLGVLDVKMSLSTIDEKLKRNRKSMITFAGFMIIGVAFLSGQFLYFFVRKRIKRLIVGTEEISAGNLLHKIEVKGHDEIDQLASSFNKMTYDLKKARDEITEWSNSLEEKVDQKTKELRNAQEHIVRMEKMVSLGKLSATVAHEINNPMAGVLNYTMLVLRMLKTGPLTKERVESMQEYLNFIKKEIQRTGDIVRNMLVFARQTGKNFSKESLHYLVESSIMLVKHQLKMKQINIYKTFNCTNDTILCDSGQIRQALVALFVNSIEAMEDGGDLYVETSDMDDKIQIMIKDTGCGIPEDIMPQIFEPFFSTKQEIKGVGIGLAVVYGIIERHKAKIDVISKVNEGTTFYIQLYRQPEIEYDVEIN